MNRASNSSRRKVGDRYVLEAMKQWKAVLGGEQSGHVIFLDTAPSGDGLLTAIRLLEVVAATGKELRTLRAEAITEFPQVLRNVRVPDTVEARRRPSRCGRRSRAPNRVWVTRAGSWSEPRGPNRSCASW